MNIISDFPWWTYLGCVLLGLIYAIIFYRKDKRLEEFPKLLVNFLGFLRACIVALLSFFLLSPLLVYYQEKLENPIVVFLQDNTSSIIQTGDSAFYSGDFLKEMKELKTSLSKDYQIESFLFDNKISSDTLQPDYKGKRTNIAFSLEEIYNRFENRNLGAIILASDGIYNEGRSPVYIVNSLTPLFVIAEGDTNAKRDLLIKRIVNNEVAILGNDFPVEMDVFFQQAKGAKSVLRITKGSKLLFSKELSSLKENELHNVKTFIPAESVGLHRYNVSITPIDGEQNLSNNQQDFYIDVLDGRQRILILTAAPHPDISAIKSALESNKNYTLEQYSINDFSEDVSQYDLIIFYQLPSRFQSIPKELISTIEEKKLSSLFVLGSTTDTKKLDEMNLGFAISGSNTAVNEVQAYFEKKFQLFALSDPTVKWLQKFPPLVAPFGKYEAKQQQFVLFSQKIGLVETPYPLLSFFEKEGKKVGLIAGEGLWQWRLHNYLANENHDAFNEIILKSTQFLALHSNQSYFRVNHAKQFEENEEILIDAQLFNESYELITEPEINFSLKDEIGNDFSYAFSKREKFYNLKIKGLPKGNYTYVAETKIADKVLRQFGQFSIVQLNLEANQTVANHRLLHQMANKTSGELYYPQQLKELEKNLKESGELSAISYMDEEINELINIKWIFYLLIILLSLEWFLRKRGGAY